MPRNPAWQRLTPDQYADMLKAQGGVCAICGNPPKTRKLDEDHNHKSGRTRGLLCHRCNRQLAAWITAAWLFRALVYLARFETT